MRPSDRLPWTSPLPIASLLVVGAVFLLGARFVVAPLVAADGFGIAVPHTAADPFLTAKGVRDIASGLAVFSLVAAAPRRVVGIYMLAASFIPCRGFLTVVNRVGPQPTPMMIFGGTAVALWAPSYFLIRGTTASSARAPQAAGSHASEAGLHMFTKDIALAGALLCLAVRVPGPFSLNGK